MSEGFEETNIYKGPLLDILNVRTAFLKEVQGHATLTYTTDMEYVLKIIVTICGLCKRMG